MAPLLEQMKVERSGFIDKPLFSRFHSTSFSTGTKLAASYLAIS